MRPLKIIMGAMSILDSDNELNTRNIPVLKAFIGQSDQQSRFYQTKARFYNYLDEFAEVEKTESKLKKEEETDPLMWIEHNIRFEEEPRVKRYRLYNESYKPVLDDINAQMKKAARPEQKTKRVTVPVTRVRTNLPGLTEKIPGLRIRQPKILLKTVLTRKTKSLLFRQSR